MSDEAPTSGWSQVPAEVLLFLITAVSVASFTRLFTEDRAVLGLLVAAATAHAANTVARRLALGVLGTTTLVGGSFVFQVSIVLYPHTSWVGLPTGATVATFVDDIQRAWELFRDVQAPVPAERGFVLAATIAVWLAASLADWAGHRLRATAEAVLPAGALFVFATLLGRGGGGLVMATVLAAAVGGFALAQRTALAATDTTWIGGRTNAGVVALARSGGLAVVTTALVAGVIVPLIPADDGGLVDWPRRGGPGRTTVSPLVDIRTRLVQQPETVVFKVQSERPDYWRLTSLDQFDGVIWSSKESFSDADGRLPSQPPDATTRDLEQTYSIVALGGIWAPAALTPVDLRQTSAELRWNGEMATLIVPTAVTSIDGASYRVVSRVPSFTPADLDGVLPDPLPDDLAAATELPSGLPSEMFDLAREVTADAPPTPYGQARALQDWFRNSFTYDVNGVNAGHGKNAITAFLEAREGYCEQFAGTYAAMARSLGLPARVAVGFTPGEVDPSGSIYTVRGRNAHAWPEVFIPDVGWVPFEPTPGRGQPGTELYTGVEPAQDSADPIPTTTTTSVSTPPAAPATPTTAPSRSTTVPPGLDLGEDVPPSGGRERDSTLTPVDVTVFVLGVTLLVLLVHVAGVAGLQVLRRRRRHRAIGLSNKVQLAWADAVASLSRLGLVPALAETDTEYAARVAGSVGPAGPALARLAALATRAAWGPSAPTADPGVVAEAGQLAGLIGVEARRHLTWDQRLRLLLDPRSSLRAPSGA